jgi:hypothetical protein
VGNKEKYDPRTYMKLGEAERVKRAVADPRGVGTLFLTVAAEA